MPPRRRRRGDPAPSEAAAVLLASPGSAFSPAAVRRAAEMAGGGTVAVLSIARVHGSGYGLPNPGLMPTAKERQAQLDVVSDAIDGLARRGVPANGQVAVTRKPVRTIAGAATRRQVTSVVLEAQPGGRVRRFVEGDLAAGVRRRLRSTTVVVEVVDR